MFNLELSILEWRSQMLSSGIGSRALLDELEMHLRDEIEQQKQFGANLEDAFQHAVEQIGSAEFVGAEFQKIHPMKGNNMNHNRIYTASLWVFAIYNVIIIASALFFLRLVGGQYNEPMGRYPAWALPWLFALTCVYTVLIVATLIARRGDSQIGHRLTRLLNWLMLAALPGGTVIGLYGLFFVDKPRLGSPNAA